MATKSVFEKYKSWRFQGFFRFNDLRWSLSHQQKVFSSPSSTVNICFLPTHFVVGEDHLSPCISDAQTFLKITLPLKY